MKKHFIYSITVLAFFIIGVVIANFIIMPRIVQMGEEIVVPNVCNLPLETAIQGLQEKNLEGVVIERRYDDIIEEGKVIIQEPLPRAKVKRGRIINLTISLGAQTVKVPHLAGVDKEKGKLITERLGLTIDTVDFLFSDSIAKEKIIRTIPAPEVVLKKGDAITLIVSKGRVLKMPSLTGKNIGEAKAVLKKMGLVLGEIKEVAGSGIKGSIIVQNPEPEQPVNIGDTISVMVIK